jgi:hypothetical protein
LFCKGLEWYSKPFNIEAQSFSLIKAASPIVWKKAREWYSKPFKNGSSNILPIAKSNTDCFVIAYQVTIILIDESISL